MRWSGFRSLLPVVLAAAALAGCGTNQGTSVAPTPVLKTDTFTGSLSLSGTDYFTFVAGTGQVTVTLKSLAPDSTLKLNMYVGVYSALYLTCTPVSGSSSIGVNGQVVGLATATTSLCIAISDAAGVIPTGATETFTLTADHY